MLLYRAIGFIGKRQMIAIPEFINVPAIPGESPNLTGDLVDLIQVQGQIKQLVLKPVLPWLQPMVHDFAFVEAGAEFHDHKLSPAMARAQWRPLVKPSS